MPPITSTNSHTDFIQRMSTNNMPYAFFFIPRLSMCNETHFMFASFNSIYIDKYILYSQLKGNDWGFFKELFQANFIWVVLDWIWFIWACKYRRNLLVHKIWIKLPMDDTKLQSKSCNYPNSHSEFDQNFYHQQMPYIFSCDNKIY